MRALVDTVAKTVVVVQQGYFPVLPPLQWVECDEGATHYNSVWDGEKLVPKPGFAMPVPASVTNYQARAVLYGHPSPSGDPGRTLFDDVDDALKAEGGLALQAWEYAGEVTRDGALVRSLGARLGMEPSELDALFMAASKISA